MSHLRRTRGKSVYDLAVLFHMKIKLIFFFLATVVRIMKLKIKAWRITAFEYRIESGIYLGLCAKTQAPPSIAFSF